MEAVLQLYDELDDLMFSLIMGWEAVRRAVLTLGLAAALILTAIASSSLMLVLSSVALSSVMTWLLMLVVSRVRQSSLRRVVADLT